jgi:hypothetical protein
MEGNTFPLRNSTAFRRLSGTAYDNSPFFQVVPDVHGSEQTLDVKKSG